jgi:hypothetical protein
MKHTIAQNFLRAGLALGLCLPLTALAQSGTFKFTDKGSAFYANVGIYASDNDDRFKKLAMIEKARTNQAENVNVPMTNPNILVVGLGGYGVSSSITFGGELNGYLGAANTYSIATTNPSYNLKAQEMGVDIMATVGAILVREQGFIVHPQIGIGYGGMTNRIKDSRATGRNYPVYATQLNSKENVVVWNGGLVLDGGLNLDYLTGSDNVVAKGFTIGLKVGYRTQLANENIRINGESAESVPAEVTAGKYAKYTLPSLGSGGPYIKLTIGVGTIKKK